MMMSNGRGMKRYSLSYYWLLASFIICHPNYWPLAGAWLPGSCTSRIPNEIRARQSRQAVHLGAADAKQWKGNVVSNAADDGKMRGCSIEQATDRPTEWIVTIDGATADLGQFSRAVYEKVTREAKLQRFQGFRPGTIPPHLEPTYAAFAMDEAARECILEALQQNNIRPFDATRSEMVLEQFCVPPAALASKKGKKRPKKKKVEFENANHDSNDTSPSAAWRAFASMKEAIDAGWKPGQSFSFVATNVKGQKLKADDEVSGAKPLGLNS